MTPAGEPLVAMEHVHVAFGPTVSVDETFEVLARARSSGSSATTAPGSPRW